MMILTALTIAYLVLGVSTIRAKRAKRMRTALAAWQVEQWTLAVRDI
jgi:hypothetical protein